MTESRVPSPHAEYDRYMERQNRRRAWWRRFGQLAFYVIGSGLALVFAALLVAGVLDLGQPRIWGTFTQTDCEPRWRGGCRPVGTWVSDDGNIVKSGVYLDGWTDDTGTARAGYQPTAIISDEANNIVHTPMWTGAGAWLTGLVLLWCVGYMLFKAASWGDITLPSRRRARRQAQSATRSAGLATRGSPRRQYRRMLEQGTLSSDQEGDGGA
ncbi:hypothetical protein [Microbacterium sp. SLBN-146]|uniref:hypothetical protein n=1 Tax=Microbacterium sp. SLBN-146 TaxID=2768457 RepID=UPI0011512FBA|nr:hypothetical protein [Microbacterium sp. SLBN-146]